VEIHRRDLDRAVADGLVTAEQAESLWGTLGGASTDRTPTRANGPGKGRALSLLLGAAGASGGVWLLVLGWERFGGAGGLFVSVALGLFLLRAGLWACGRSHPEAGALLVAVAVAMAPVAVRGAQHWLGLDGALDAPVSDLSSWTLSHGFLPAVAAVIAAALAAWFVPAPFLSAVLVAALWFLAMDGAAAVFGPGVLWGQRALLSSVLGLVVLGAGVAVDGRAGRDRAFWLYLAGLVAFSGGLASHHAGSNIALAFDGAVHGSLVFLAFALRRRMFAVFGAVGLASVLGQVAERTLVDAAVPLVFAGVALALAGGAVAYDRFEAAWSSALRARFPGSVRRLLPPLERA